MAKKSKQQQKFLALLQSKKNGDILTLDQILNETSWKEKAFKTHVSKNAYSRYIRKENPSTYRLLVDGAEISEEDFYIAATQVHPSEIKLCIGESLQGSLSNYILKEKLGEGAVGQVWKAQNERSENYAVKVMLPRRDLLEPTKLENVGKRFYRESRNGSNLNCVSIISYRDSGIFCGNPFLVMELADESLAQRLNRVKKIPLGETCQIINSILDALIYLHSQKIIHRDVKPANILILKRGYVLADLGIVKWSDFNTKFTDAATITKSTVQLGSWFYMPPEQQTPHKVTYASDIYALGVTWIELLVGEKPSPQQIAANRFEIPVDNSVIEGIIRKMLSYDQSDRPNAIDIKRIIKLNSERMCFDNAIIVNNDNVVLSLNTSRYKSLTKTKETNKKITSCKILKNTPKSVRNWLRTNGYDDIADKIDTIMTKWENEGKHTRRDWWVVLAGTKSGRPCIIEGIEFPILKTAQIRLGRNPSTNAIQKNAEETYPPIIQSGRWAQKV